ncbi:hypothetical protein OIU85_005030 [Salix viminalis]|uniref:Uncharacterized protein n=1 Tax=Salix viminalis TaxID=40686 RepID=A0A9Q0PUJ2_SALVM|nr:hypothetical protein OIU85_005030 [Salix viminalis]
MASSSKPQISCQKLSITSILFLSVLLMFLLFSFKPQTGARNVKKPFSIIKQKSWFDELIEKKIDSEPIKIGLVNVDDHVKHAYDRMHGQLETVTVDFRPVSEELKWESFFPEWIDEDARVPCGSGSEKEGIRDVFRLQVNLVVANLAVTNGLTKDGGDRTVYVIFMGSCGPHARNFQVRRSDDSVRRLLGLQARVEETQTEGANACWVMPDCSS